MGNREVYQAWKEQQEAKAEEERKRLQSKLGATLGGEGLYDPQSNQFNFGSVKYDPLTGNVNIFNPEDATKSLYGYNKEDNMTFFDNPQFGGVALRGRYDPGVYGQITEDEYAAQQKAIDDFYASIAGSVAGYENDAGIGSMSEADWRANQLQHDIANRTKDFFGQYYNPQDMQKTVNQYTMANAYQAAAQRLGLEDTTGKDFYASLAQQAQDLTAAAQNQPYTSEDKLMAIYNNPNLTDEVKLAILRQNEAGLSTSTKPEPIAPTATSASAPIAQPEPAMPPEGATTIGGSGKQYIRTNQGWELDPNQPVSAPQDPIAQAYEDSVNDTAAETAPAAETTNYDDMWQSFFSQVTPYLQSLSAPAQAAAPAFDLTSGLGDSQISYAPLSGSSGITAFGQQAQATPQTPTTK